MDINKLLREHGYGGRSDYGEIAKFAVDQAKSFREHEGHAITEVELLGVIEWQFGSTLPKIEMNDKPAPYNLFLSDELPVDSGAIDQLKTALRLPVAIGGAGMPDLHKGYSLPIGGVVALDNAISPAFVGYDISCMMQLTILRGRPDISPWDLEDKSVRQQFLRWMLASSSFGVGAEGMNADHIVMQDPLWHEVPFLRNLKDTAWKQLGSSGGGNHFMDLMFGYEDGVTADGDLVDAQWIGLLTHSGSRGVGNKVGGYYAKLADAETRRNYKAPVGYGWLDLNSDLGEEYLAVMQLMGRYAQANHDIIHQRFLDVSGFLPSVRVSNRHNYAWVDEDGVVIHRKGATPAEKGVYGIIPGSSGTPSFLVKGLGNPNSLYSASHGAGRPFSRTEAKRQYDQAAFESHMQNSQITYYGVAPDETFMAYKDISLVMKAQQELVSVEAVMYPRVVVMGGTSDDGD